MTKEEFVKRYAEGLKMTVDECLRLFTPHLCDCGECQGWKMVSKEKP